MGPSVTGSCMFLGSPMHEDYRGEFINSFVFYQPITVVYCGQLTNKSTQFLQHSIYKLSLVNVHAPMSILDWFFFSENIIFISGLNALLTPVHQ